MSEPTPHPDAAEAGGGAEEDDRPVRPLEIVGEDAAACVDGACTWPAGSEQGAPPRS